MKQKKDKGIALITVLLTLSFMFIMVTSIVASGELTFRMTLSSAKGFKNSYKAESKLTRTMWNIVYDIKTYGNNRRLGFKDDLGSETQEQEFRYLADGNPYYYHDDLTKTTVVIEDANQGFDFSGNITSSKIAEIMKLIKLPAEATEEEREPVEFFIDKLVDYTDRNDLFRENGMEREEYEEEFGFDLPRNAPIEFAEEVMWIPGIEEALFAQKSSLEQDIDMERFNFNVSDYIKVVPYRGKSFPRNSRPNFFASTDYQIMHLADLTADELEEVIEARQAWYDDGENIEDSIPELYSKLSRAFSFTESKIYKIKIQVMNNDGSATVNTETIIDLNRTLPRYQQNTFSGFKYWRKVNF